MKLRVPPGCGAASHQGCAIEIDANGRIDVEEDAAQALLAHGFTLCESASVPDVPRTESPDTTCDEIEGLTRRELFAFLKVKGVGVSLPVTNDELRALARRAAQHAACHVRDESEGS